MSEKHIGKVIQVIGPVLDIQFKDGELPELLNAIEIDNHGQKLVVEVAQLTGDNVARCIAMSSTDGLVRGTDAVDTGESIKVPVGDQCLGRVFNLLGEPVDNKPPPPPAALVLRPVFGLWFVCTGPHMAGPYGAARIKCGYFPPPIRHTPRLWPRRCRDGRAATCCRPTAAGHRRRHS